MSITRPSSLFALLGAIVFVSVGSFNIAKAEPDFKGKKVKLIIASSPGGGTDRIGRLLSQYMEKEGLGTKILPEAFDWHYAGSWNHIFNNIEHYQNELEPTIIPPYAE